MISMFVIYTCVNRAQTHSRVALRLTKLLVIYINMSRITLPSAGRRRAVSEGVGSNKRE